MAAPASLGPQNGLIRRLIHIVIDVVAAAQ
jgi:hypothetical protein